MGFFDLKAECVICKKEIGLMRFQIANKEWLCTDCFNKCGFTAMTPITTMTTTQIKDVIYAKEQNVIALQSFVATKKIGTYLEVDEKEKTWLIPSGILGGKKNSVVYSYNDIVDYELLEDGSSVTKGGLGSAVAGGVLLGNVGAVVGGVTGGKKTKAICNSLKIKITLNNMTTPTTYINFVISPTKKDSYIYKSNYSLAQECLSTLQLICNSVSEQKQTSQNNRSINSDADEIMKFKQLLDAGVITQQEFEAKKKQLLGL